MGKNFKLSQLQTSGARLRYLRTWGGPAVLLIHGTGVGLEGWRPQVDGLSDRFSLVALDNRGIGGSQIEDGELTIEAMAADALAVMDVEGIDRFHLVGHSMGGLIAQHIALAVPQRIKSLALLSTFARGDDVTRLTPAMLLTIMRAHIGTRRMRRNAFLELILPASYLDAVDRDELAERLRPLFGRDLADQPPILTKQLRAMERYSAEARLAELEGIPTLVVSASEDRIAPPASGRVLAAAIPGARLVEIPDAGHAMTIQRAPESNRLLRDHFLAAEMTMRAHRAPAAAAHLSSWYYSRIWTQGELERYRKSAA